MVSIVEAQSFVEQFDKCLPLCERGDVVSVVNALHTLNCITQASINQAKEVDPVNGRDFFCSFLLELELAVELYISPTKKLGTIDGGLPALYSFSDEDVAALSPRPSPLTKSKVRRFLLALDVTPSEEFEGRGSADVVREFLRLQVKPDKVGTLEQTSEGRLNNAAVHSKNTSVAKSISVSWADQCSSSESDFDDMPPLEDGDEDEEPVTKVQTKLDNTISNSLDDATLSRSDEDDSDVDDALIRNEAAYTFLFSQPVHRHFEADDHDAAFGLSKPTPEENYGIGAKYHAARPDHFYKTRMCKNWEMHGSCQYGTRCNFAHGNEELRSANTAIQAWASAQGGGNASDKREDTSERASRPYKTRMCMNFGQTGNCKFGDKCSFAHSKSELARRPANPATSSSGRGAMKR